MTVILYLAWVATLVFAVVVGRRLWRWERLLRAARISIAYKGKVKNSATLFDWLQWANRIDKDKTANGQVVYRSGATTVAIIKPAPKGHGKTTHRQVKPDKPRRAA